MTAESAAEIAGRLALRRIARGWQGACPACGYKSGLRLTERGGRPLWWCASCRDQGAVTAAIRGASAPVSALPGASAGADAEERRAAALRLWDAALPWQRSPVETYLHVRLPGLDLDGLRDVAFLPEAKHPGGRHWPCMLALLRDAAGRPVAVHRTFLAPGGAGKAPVDPARMTLGPVAGAAVRLREAGPRLVVAEGTETALAAGALLGAPAWAAVSAGNLRDALELPATVREAVVAADRDAPGLAAAEAAARRWRAHRAVKIAKPHRAGADFADLYAERARHG
jgi:hypothetical protein